MGRSAQFIAGIGTIVAIGVIVPLASSQTAPPPGTPGYVDVNKGECIKQYYIDHVPGAGFRSPEEAIASALPSQSASMEQRVVVAGKHVVFEKHEDGKVVAAYDVVKQENGNWVLDTTQEKAAC